MVGNSIRSSVAGSPLFIGKMFREWIHTVPLARSVDRSLHSPLDSILAIINPLLTIIKPLLTVIKPLLNIIKHYKPLLYTIIQHLKPLTSCEPYQGSALHLLSLAMDRRWVVRLRLPPKFLRFQAGPPNGEYRTDDLVGGLNTSEKYESQLGWWHYQVIWKNTSHVPNHQPVICCDLG